MKDRPIRFIIDDCFKFLDREYRRHNRYDGLIFDPPAFGRSGGHVTWSLDADLPLLMTKVRKLMSPEAKFVLLSCHDILWPAERLAELLKLHLPADGIVECGELVLSPIATAVTSHESGSQSGSEEASSVTIGNKLPLGQFARWFRK